MVSPVNSFCNGFKEGSLKVVSSIPLVGRLVKPIEQNPNLEEGSNTVNEVAIDQLPTPVSGGINCCTGLGCAGGTLAGAAIGLTIFAFAGVTVWGTGTGLWVEGDKNDSEGLITAGKIMVLYVTIPLAAVSACIGGIAGGVAGGVAAS